MLSVPTRFAPPRPGAYAVSRDRLLARLRGSRDRKLILITASAGYGKTTLLGQWRQALLADGDAVAWVSIIKADGGRQHVLADLREALRRAGVEVLGDAGIEEAGTEGRGRHETEAIVSAAAEHPNRIHFVIDDYQNVLDGSVHHAMADLVYASTDNLSFTIASRTTPSFPVGRLRAMHQVAEIQADDLSFDRAEADEALSRGCTRPFGADDLRAAYDLSEGWPAGVQLISYSLSRRSGPLTSVRDLARKTSSFRPYMDENILASLDPVQVDLLERLSISPRFSLPLARVLAGSDDVDEVVADLDGNQVFVTALEVEGTVAWYRLHPLLADVLATRLAARGRDEVRRLHGRAAEWYAQEGFLLDAIRHAKFAGELDKLPALVERSPLAIRSLSHLGSVRQLVDELDPAIVASSPRLLVVGSWALLLTAQVRKAAKWVSRIETNGNSPELALQGRLLQAGIALYQDDTERVMALAGSIDPLSLRDRFARQALVTMLITSYQAAGRLDDSDQLSELFRHEVRAETDDDLALIVEALRIGTLLMRGDAASAASHGRSILTRAETVRGRRSVAAAVCAAFLADGLCEQGCFEEAREVLADRLEMLQSSPPDPLLRGLLAEAEIAGHFGSEDAAAAALEQAEIRCLARGSDRAAAVLMAERLSLLHRLGDTTRRDAVWTRLDRLSEPYRGASGFLGEIGVTRDLAACRLALWAERWEEALRMLWSLRARAEARARVPLQATVALLEALARSRTGRLGAADAALTEALQLCSRGHLVRTLLREGPTMLELLARRSDVLALPARAAAFLNGILPAGPDHLGSDSEGRLAPNKGSPEGREAPQELTGRERDILGLLTQSMSNKRIALTLGIAPATVKWNLQNVFLKLGLSSRYDVIVWARRNGIGLDH